MNKATLMIALIALATTAIAKDDKPVTYVGDGRWHCVGSSAQCAQVDANNRQRESQRSNDYQRSQDAAQAVVDRERRKEAERNGR